MDDATPYALALLAAAIVLFKLSTLQWRWPVRLVVWIAGAASLAAAATISITAAENFGVWRALGDLATHWRAAGDSLVWQAVSRNAATLPNYLSPVTDFAILIAGLAGLGALIAFTPGRRWERFTRSALIGVIGVIVGAMATMGVVALGFGGEAHRAVLLGEGEQVRALDGDTLMINETSIRLWGVDAPELRQTCGEPRAACGEAAKDELEELLAGGLVECVSRRTARGRRVESFGRPLMQCFLRNGDDRTDITEALIRKGFAAAFRDREGDPVEADYAALESSFNQGCTLRPEVWRRNDAARRQWESGVRPDVSDNDFIGCEPTSATAAP